jgi:MFS transporter, UMF1 family
MNDKKVMRAWAMFDWANSAYALVIATAIFPVYFIKATPDYIHILGNEYSNSAIFSFSVSFSYIIIALLSPLLAGIADNSGRRKFFMIFFTTLGAVSCMAMFFFSGNSPMAFGVLTFVFATIGFAGSLVFYDSYLPLIASEDQYDRLSAKGYAYGYVGSVLLLIFILFMIQMPEIFGISDTALPARIGFALVGIWWIGFAQYSFRYLPKDTVTKQGFRVLMSGYKEIRQVVKEARKMGDLKKFLAAFFFYSAGLQSVIYLATIFAESELTMESGELILVVLIIQLIAVAGAWIFAIVSEKIGNKRALLVQIAIWVLICLGAYYTQSKMSFYSLAAAVGLVLGGIQALSRASYSKLLRKDEDDVTSYFSLYDVVYKVSIVSGTFIFGIVVQITGNMRYSVLALGLLFIIGFILMTQTRIEDTKKLPNIDLEF